MADVKLLLDRYCLGVYSAVGDPKRKYEDRAWSGLIETKSELSFVVGMVADGVGSADFGANAAQLAIDIATESIRRSTKTAILEIITDAFHHANRAVYEGNENSNGDGLTTLVMAVVHEGRCYIGNVGDSRVYWVQDSGKMLQLTMDHTYYNIYGGDPKSQEANMLINAIGKQPSVEVDLAIYLVGPEDRKTAVKMGKAGLPLEAGDSIMLCSDGLIKSSPEGKPYTETKEIVDAIKNEIGDKAAVKMVGFAEGRKVDDNVSAVTIQYLTPERIEQMEERREAAKRKAMLTRIGVGVAGLALLGLLIVAVFSLIRTQQALQVAQAATAVVIQITNTPVPTMTPTLPIDPGVARVDELHNTENGTYVDPEGSQYPLRLSDTLRPGTRLQTNDSSARIVVGEAAGQPSVLFIFPSSDVTLNFGSQLRPELVAGSIFIWPGTGAGKVAIANVEGLVASVEGSRMIVERRGEEIIIYCFEGTCRLDHKLEGFIIQERYYQSYNPATRQKGPAAEMAYFEVRWMWNTRCNYCMSDMSEFIPTPTPTASNTVKPVVSNNSASSGGSSSSGGSDGGEDKKTNTPTATVPPPANTRPPVATNTATVVPSTATANPLKTNTITVAPPTATPSETPQPTTTRDHGGGRKTDTPTPTTPVPVETTPAPVETTPAPVETTPAPVETTPAPVESPSVPAAP